MSVSSCRWCTPRHCLNLFDSLVVLMNAVARIKQVGKPFTIKPAFSDIPAPEFNNESWFGYHLLFVHCSISSQKRLSVNRSVTGSLPLSLVPMLGLRTLHQFFPYTASNCHQDKQKRSKVWDCRFVDIELR